MAFNLGAVTANVTATVGQFTKNLGIAGASLDDLGLKGKALKLSLEKLERAQENLNNKLKDSSALTMTTSKWTLLNSKVADVTGKISLHNAKIDEAIRKQNNWSKGGLSLDGVLGKIANSLDLSKKNFDLFGSGISIAGSSMMGFAGGIGGMVIDTITNIGKTAFNVAKGGVAALGLGFVALTTYGSKLATTAQESRIAFDTILGSSEKGAKMMTDIVKFAKETPFNRLQINDLAQQLLGMGFAGGEVIPTLNKLGNISAGVGKQRLPFLTLALAQVRTAGRLTGSELRQFSENGVDLLNQLAKNAGVSMAVMKKRVEDGKVPFKDVDKVLTQMTSRGGKFFNLMQKQSLTFGGVMSNITDGLQSVVLRFMGVTDEGTVVEGSIFDMMTQKAGAFKTWLDTNGAIIGSWGGRVFGAIGTGISLIWSTVISPLLADFKNWFDNGGKEAIKRFLKDGFEKFVNFLTYFATDLYPNKIAPKLAEFGAWISDEKRIQDIQKIADTFIKVVDSLNKIIDTAKLAKNAMDGVSSNQETKKQGLLGIATNPLFMNLFAGKRAKGGPVNPGKLYEVGENNKAEMLMMGGKQYMIPGNKGQVFNQQQMSTTNNQQKTINVTNYGSLKSQAQTLLFMLRTI